MDTLKNLRVGTRLGLAFALLLALLLAMAGVGAMLAKSINSHAMFYPESVLPSLRVIHRIHVDLSDSRRLEQQYILTDDDKEKKSLAERIAKARSNLAQRVKDYDLLIGDDQDGALLKQVAAGAAAYFAVQDKVIKASDEGLADPTQATAARDLTFGPARAAFAPVRDNVEKWWDHNEKLAGAATDAASAAYGRVLWIFASASLAALLVGAGAALLITRSITGPVVKASEAVRAVASGDLTVRLHADSRDELGQLLGNLDEMTQSLARMVSGVRQGCDQINVAAAEIAQGNADLSARTESQASSLQQTAASVEEMAAQIRANADNARQADQLANHASEVAGAGGTAVGEVVTTMDAISASSRKISDIIGTIDGIAFQTNILALNAAVEAARAGEQGRGFAVVAGEVRLLAQRSAEAAKEIKSLIGDSVGKVESGSAQVLSARETIGQMVNEVRKVTDLVGEITVSSREQSEGVTQINQAVSQLDQATQQNAALVEQTAAAAESMRQQTTRLTEAVAVFRVDAGSAAGMRGAAPKPAAPRPVASPRPAAASKPLASPKPAVAKPVAKAAPAPRAPLPAPAAPLPAPKVAAAPSEAEGDWETF
ncbi:methyl-accepting chemotaxis protein [Roseateles saccharophilus]|uniref:Methyl-accepting chemotaxis protein n=1 Tax=Roseateles saccharophilus TaxID=304 RepID=A0A4R3UR58_ROSSA|nr:methyl-accepting chemotaxis protein [Roseateles saccharophilus]MDG0833283.1 HAMP domain-containing protein [Roseateles saccharophilus]TCU94366.1 methyl-accepting chemotaxis protein [Roseateles saccharophilus]